VELWKTILIAFGGNAALVAILAWLAKSLIFSWLENSAAVNQIVFSKLHEKRADAVSKIYVGLHEYISECKTFILQGEHSDENGRELLLENISSTSKLFSNLFQANKLYLSKALCNKIENTFKDSQILSHEFIFHLGSYVGENSTREQFRENWERAIRSFQGEVPTLLSDLENEFRKLLGTEKHS